MKKCIALLVCLVLLCSMSTALANSWGLKGELLTLVSRDKAWNDYTSRGKVCNTAAVMGTRYHNVLMIANNGKLETYTKAVWQPDDEMPAPTVTANENTVILRYSDEMWFSFLKTNGEYALYQARVNGMSIRANDDLYSYTATHDDGPTAVIARSYALRDFNISLFPQSINEVRHLNYMRSLLDSETFCSYPLERMETGAGSGTAAVLSAPFEGAWRASKGKAAVGLSGDLWKLFSFRNQDGQEYWCIRYDVSQRTQRIGFVKRSAVDNGGEAWEETNVNVHVPLQVIQETYLTDDPDVSQFAQIELPVGSVVNCMGRMGDDYAYVSAEVRDGRLTDGGQIIWGFVPLRDVQPADIARPDTALMQQLDGCYEFWAGGLGVADYLVLHADGTFEGYSYGEDVAAAQPETTGRWYVRPYDPACGLYWDHPEYEIVFERDRGTCAVHGFSLTEDGFGLTNWEGGGGYLRIESLPQQGADNG